MVCSSLHLFGRFRFASRAEEKVIRVFEAHHNFLQKFARICRIHQPIPESNIFYRLSHIPIQIFIEACWVFLRVILFKSWVFPINPFRPTIEPSQKFRKLHIKKNVSILLSDLSFANFSWLNPWVMETERKISKIQCRYLCEC